VQPSQIVVIVDAKNNIQIGSNTVTIAQAPAAFAQLQANTGGRFRSVIIKADPDAYYGTILQVMDAAKKVNLTYFGLANHIQGTPQGAVAQ
jgi:biopolymer transport protein ExbD